MSETRWHAVTPELRAVRRSKLSHEFRRLGAAALAIIFLHSSTVNTGAQGVATDALKRGSRLSQAAGTPVLPTLTFDIQVNPSAAGVLGYKANKSPVLTGILPDDNRVMDAWLGKGRLLYSSFFNSASTADGKTYVRDFRAVPVTVRIRAAGDFTASVRRVALDVQDSQQEPQPMFYLDQTMWDFDGGRNPAISFVNFGWAPPTTARLDIEFAAISDRRWNEAPRYDPRRTATPIFSKEIRRPIKPSFELDLKPHLERLGVDSKMMQEIDNARIRDSNQNPYCANGQSTGLYGIEDHPLESEADKKCLQKIRQSGALGQLAAFARVGNRAPETRLIDEFWGYRFLLIGLQGRLAYTWIDSLGREQRKVVEFALEFPVARIEASVECGGDGLYPDRDPAGVSKVSFALDKKGYRVELPFSGALARGEALQMDLRLQSPRTSKHVFRVFSETADGRKFWSEPIEIFAVVPSRVPGEDTLFEPFRENREVQYPGDWKTFPKC